MTVSAEDTQPLLLINIQQLVTLRSAEEDAGPRRGSQLRELAIIEDGAVLCAGGKIVAVGTTKDAVRDQWVKQHKNTVVEIDCSDRVVIPGFVDSHTHPVFAEPRLVDFEKRIAGATYEQIAHAGGGIASSVAAVREASRKELTDSTLKAFRQMAAQGTTTIEAKTGYGLTVEAEMKSLEAIRDAAKQFPGTVIPTLLGAHIVPPEFRDNRDEYVRLICEEMVPQASDKGLADYVDVFWERGAFNEDEAGCIFESARQHGLGLRAHVCQMSPASLKNLLQYDPASLDHMDFVMDEELSYVAERNVVAALLPASNYFLATKDFPPARRLIDAGVAVSLATDYNPGTAPTVSMPFVLSLACTQMRMTPAEAIAAATINGAHALRIADRKGSIEPGKDADLAVFDVRDYREIPYWFASDKCVATIMHAQVV